MYSPTPPLHPQPLQPDAAPRPVWQLDQTLRAGFPSPALDEGARRIDLNEVLVRHPEATFVMRVAGDSMREAGIDEGDTVVVDRAIRPAHGMVVVAVFDGEFTVKRLELRAGRPRLLAANPSYPAIEPREGQTLEIWGVVAHCIKSFVTMEGKSGRAG